MSDIVERLRNWRTVHLTQLRYVMESAADEIERLRLSAKGDCPVPENAANEDKALTAAERSVASLGSQPVAWRIYADDGSETVFLCYELARAAADEWNWSVQPLYRSPTLTDAEREAIEVAAAAYADDHGERFAATLRALLERTK